MDFLSLQKNSFQGEVDNTSYKREFETSPVFVFSNSGTIATSGELIMDFASLNSQTEKYSPFNILTIHNTSSVKIKIFPNQDRSKSFVIPTGTSRTFTQDQIRFIRSLIIVNQSSTVTITANQIDVEIQKDIVNEDSNIKRKHKVAFADNKRTEVF